MNSNRADRRQDKKSRATILLSGGLDSACCLAFYLRRSFKVEAVFVDYGQASTHSESRAARAISHHYSVPLRVIKLTPAQPKGPGLIRGRNAFLLLVALTESKVTNSLVALGIHAGTNYDDCSPVFVRRMQSVFDLCTGGTTQICAPFLKWRKPDIWAFAHGHGVPIQLTYSCECGLPQPCGSCDSCAALEALRASSMHKN